MRMGRAHRRKGREPFQRFTAQARAVVTSAQSEAERFGHNYLGTEHLLLGLFAVEQGVISNVLANVDLTHELVRARLAQLIGYGNGTEPCRLRVTPRAKQVFERATDEAQRLNQRYVAPEHLLLALSGAKDGIAASILNEQGVTLDRVRAEVISVLSSTGPVETEPGDERAGSTVVMCRLDDRALGALDTLIEAGICTTRSDAASWLIQAGIESNTSLFEAIYETVVEIHRLRQVAQTLVDDATGYRPNRPESTVL